MNWLNSIDFQAIKSIFKFKNQNFYWKYKIWPGVEVFTGFYSIKFKDTTQDQKLKKKVEFLLPNEPGKNISFEKLVS